MKKWTEAVLSSYTFQMLLSTFQFNVPGCYNCGQAGQQCKHSSENIKIIFIEYICECWHFICPLVYCHHYWHGLWPIMCLGVWMITHCARQYLIGSKIWNIIENYKFSSLFNITPFTPNIFTMLNSYLIPCTLLISNDYHQCTVPFEIQSNLSEVQYLSVIYVSLNVGAL